MKTNELKCTDLRIGNLIDYFGDIIKVDIIDCFDGKERVGGKTKDGEHVYDKPTYFDPIELTEEMLVKIEFYKKSIGDALYRYYKEVCIDNYSYLFDYVVIPKDEYISLKVTKAENEDDEVDYFTIFYNDNIKNLHQLQNAYYCLTNEELEVEL